MMTISRKAADNLEGVGTSLLVNFEKVEVKSKANSLAKGEWMAGETDIEISGGGLSQLTSVE